MAKKPILRSKESRNPIWWFKGCSNLNIELNPGELVGLIGPNGAGKTTYLICLQVFMRRQKAIFFFKVKELTGLPPFKVTRKGISRTFQNIRLFNELSVLR